MTEKSDHTRVIVIGTAAEASSLARRVHLEASGLAVTAVFVPTREVDHGLDALEVRLSRKDLDLALVSIPAVMDRLIDRVRTSLRRRGIPERYVPPFGDLLAGVCSGGGLAPTMDELLDRPHRGLDHDRISRLVSGRRVLVTGAGGSIGSELAHVIAEYAPAEIVLMDRSEHALFEIDRQIARSHPGVARRASLIDVADRAATLELFERVRPQLVVHAAAHKHVPMSEEHPWQAIRNNVLGSRAAVDAAVAARATHFIQVSTDKAVEPRSIMGATKRLAEVLVGRTAAEHSISCAVVRFGNVLGSSGSVLDIWRRELADGGPITLTDRRMKRYLMTVHEAAGLVLQAGSLASHEPAAAGGVYVLDMGEPVTIMDLARRFVASHGLRMSGDPGGHGHISVRITGIRPGEKLEEALAHRGDVLEPTEHPAVSIWRDRPPSASVMTEVVERLLLARRRRDPNLAEMVMGIVRQIDRDGQRIPDLGSCLPS